MKKGFLIILGLLLLLVAVLIVKTFLFQSKQVEVARIEPSVRIDTLATSNLGGAIRFRTISHQNPAALDSSSFRAFHAFLETTYPLAHEALRRRTVSDLSLVYTWTGRDTTLKPVLLLSHYDVVPVDSSFVEEWSYPPFEGIVQDGFIWGRGALDDKVGVIGLMEAVEQLLREEFVPPRTVILAFGHDEEVGGRQGAVQIAAWLAAQGVQPAYILDEGGAVVYGAIPGLKEPVALIGIAEKGFLSLELKVTAPGGHSSMPPPQTAIGILSAAIERLEENPLPAQLRGAAAQMFEYVGPEMPFMQRMVFANLWLFRPVLVRMLAGVSSTNAVIRTTTAATMFSAGIQDNVLPPEATAVVNFRILPGQSSSEVIQQVEKTIDDERITLTPVGTKSEPSPVSYMEGVGFDVIRRSIQEVHPHDALLVAPFLVLGGTDSRHYGGLSDQVFRFTPFTFHAGEENGIHGTNERISLNDFNTVIRFYYQLIKNTDMN